MTEIAVQQHFVTFYSPGTIVAEQTRKPIESWDVMKAIEIAREIKERHGATPYGFRFTTKGRTEDELDSSVIATSPFYWLGGDVETLEQIEARCDPSERILLKNMKYNNWKKVITNRNSYKWTQLLGDDDIILEFKP